MGIEVRFINMSKLSKTEKIVKFLEEHQDKKFTTREIVENLLVLYPEDFSEKRKKYKDEKNIYKSALYRK